VTDPETRIEELRQSDSFVFATADLALYDVRYHVPRNQVWEGSRGGQKGKVHLHVREDLRFGRIKRRRGQALCLRNGWYARPLDVLEVQALCPRCAELERKRRG
jgi:hypothetical protein